MQDWLDWRKDQDMCRSMMRAYVIHVMHALEQNSLPCTQMTPLFVTRLAEFNI